MPLVINDDGKKIAELINAGQTFKNHKEKLIALVEKKLAEKKTANPYDIQEQSFFTAAIDMQSMLSDVEIKKIKNVAFSRGEKIAQIMGSIFGIYLRDAILDSKGIKTQKTIPTNANSNIR